MAELTKEWLKQTIAEYEANRDELPFGLDTNSAIELQAFKLALASLEAKPIGAFHIAEQQVDGTSDYLKDGEWPIDNGIIEVYAAPPVPVVPAALPENDDEDGHDIDYLEPSEVYALGRTAGWNACRAAMLQAEPVSNSDELPLDYLQGHKDGLEWAAQQAEANHPQTGDWLYDDPIDLARAIRKGPDMPTVQGGNSPVTPDGWISCSERMPDSKTAVLVAREFDRKGDWRMKWATYIPGHPDANDGWIIPGASWIPSHWMPLPEPPQEVNRG
ncbi:DUF551 domain-containing protein [Escherichia coli]|nr:DUF551 domain-containing protein [Escherichia coli]WHI20376.1 DUF551 domain-containing protein [Escherichia coli]